MGNKKHSQQRLNNLAFEDFLNKELPKEPVVFTPPKLVPPVAPITTYRIPFILL